MLTSTRQAIGGLAGKQATRHCLHSVCLLGPWLILQLVVEMKGEHTAQTLLRSCGLTVMKKKLIGKGSVC
jgi:hypothetical protein